MRAKSTANYTTAILETPSGNGFIIAGSVPATCLDADGNCKLYPTEQAALDAILADPWIQKTDQPTQMADCSFYRR